MHHPQYAAIHAAMQKLIPIMRRRAQQNNLYPYKNYLAHEWVKFLNAV